MIIGERQWSILRDFQTCDETLEAKKKKKTKPPLTVAMVIEYI